MRRNLVDGDDVSVEVPAVVGDVLVGRLPARLASLAVAIAEHDAGCGLHPGPLRRDLRPDLVDLEVAVHAVDDGLLVRVFHHDVLVKEAVRVLRGRRREAEQVRIEIFENLAPERIDAPVTLVDEDDVEELRRDRLAVDDRQRLPRHSLIVERRVLLQVRVEIRLALQDRVEALDRRDDDLAGGA